MLVWLEDRQDTVVPYLKFVKSDLDVNFKIFATPVVFSRFLEESYSEDEEKVALLRFVFVVDIMMPGVTDLSNIGIEHAPTLYGNHTGYVFVDRYLRRNGSVWQNVPVCFLTERSRDGSPNGIDANVAQLNERGQGPVDICRKYDQAEFDRFKTLMKDWLDGG